MVADFPFPVKVSRLPPIPIISVNGLIAPAETAWENFKTIMAQSKNGAAICFGNSC